MKFSTTIELLVVTAWTSTALELRETSELELDILHPRQAVNGTQLIQLPECSRDCSNQVLPEYGCSNDDASCFCSNKNLTASMEACIMSNCTVQAQLTTEKVLADVCGAPFRDRGPLTRRLNWAMFTVATLFVAGRFAARARRFGGSGFSWDDWTVLFCYVLLVPTDVSSEIEVQNGLGKDMYQNTLPQIVKVLQMFYLGELFYNIIVMLTKTSLVLLYLRIWQADSATRAFRTLCWIIIALLTATWIAGALVIIFQCHPVSYTWTRVTGTTTGTCVNLSPFTYAYAAINISYDVIVFFLPIHSLLKLNLPLPKKIGICSIFLVGFLVTICSIVRLQYLVRISDSANITWDFQYIGMWSLVEANFSIVCCCMPAISGLIKRVWTGRFGAERRISTGASPGTTQQPKGVDDGFDSSRRDSPGSVHLEKGEKREHHVLPHQELGRVPSYSDHTQIEIPGGHRTLQISHQPFQEPKTQKYHYRDDGGMLHEITITDRPIAEMTEPELRRSEGVVEVDRVV